MNFSVERKASRKKRDLRRTKEEMIKNESLHINDTIEYSRFLELYSIYGGNLAEDEFADIFLDIAKTDYYDLKKRSRCRILKKEIVTPADIELMKVKLIKTLGLKVLDEKHYDELEEIYNSIPTKLSFVPFVEMVLDVAQQTISRTNLVRTRKATIFSKTNIDYFDDSKCDEALYSTIGKLEKIRKEIPELKDTIAQDRGIHMNDSLNKEEFLELYQIYGINFSEMEFAENVLGIDSAKIKGLLNDKRKDVKIWTNEIVTLDYLLKIREETIKKEKLHINEKISYAQFKEIYNKHSGILTEVDFALEILDIPRTRYNELKKDKCESLVLSSIEVPEEFYSDAKEKIKTNEHVYRGKPITYEEFLKLHEKYGFVTNDIEFGEKTLEMDPDSIRSLKRGDIKTSWILKGEENEKSPEEHEKDIKRLRQIVIKENKLHIEDRMTGSKFTELYEKYGFGMSQKDFALGVLDIKDYRLNVILRDESQGTAILTNEKVSKDKIKALRKAFFSSGEHCTEDSIDYKEFLRLYDLYGGILSERQFAEKVLFMSADRLTFIRTHPGEETEIFCRAKVSDAYIANLKARLIKESLLYYKQPVTLPFFNRLYKNARTILSKPNFAKEILEVNRWSYRELENKESNAFFILTTSGTEENREKFLKRQDEKIKQMLEAGFGYDEIEENVNLPSIELKKNIDSLYENGLDKENITKIYLYNTLKNNKKVDKSRLEESEISEFDISKIKGAVENELRLKPLQKKCAHIIDEVLDTPKNKKNLVEYIKLCKELYGARPKNMPEDILDTLQDCIEFLDTNLGNSLFFIKVCIDRMDYIRANGLVTFNMHSDSLSIEDKKKLQEMRVMIKEASERKDEVIARKNVVSIKDSNESIFKREAVV